MQGTVCYTLQRAMVMYCFSFNCLFSMHSVSVIRDQESWLISNIITSRHLFMTVKKKSKFLPSPFLVNRAAPISVPLAFGPQSCASAVNPIVGGWPSGSTVCFAPMLFPEVLNAKQGNSMYHFSSLWYDSTGYRTPTYRVQSEHSTTWLRTRSWQWLGYIFSQEFNWNDLFPKVNASNCISYFSCARVIDRDYCVMPKEITFWTGRIWGTKWIRRGTWTDISLFRLVSSQAHLHLSATLIAYLPAGLFTLYFTALIMYVHVMCRLLLKVQWLPCVKDYDLFLFKVSFLPGIQGKTNALCIGKVIMLKYVSFLKAHDFLLCCSYQ